MSVSCIVVNRKYITKLKLDRYSCSCVTCEFSLNSTHYVQCVKFAIFYSRIVYDTMITNLGEIRNRLHGINMTVFKNPTIQVFVSVYIYIYIYIYI